MQDVNWTALIIFVLLFAFITWLGFAAARWRRGDLDVLHEWGLGGRRFGTVITWFLVGGDLYTAYTFIAVPALAYGAGAVAFFAVPYTVMIYPILFLVFPRLWNVCRKHHYITAADFVRGRFGNRWLALAVAITGIIATLPYIALQLVGLQVVIGGLGVASTGYAGDLPLLIAFVILAAFTYSSGLRAPASIAIVKDLLIYLTAFVAVIVIPIQLGGFAKIFAAVPAQKVLLAVPGANTTGSYGAYATLALGSALALFLYPHSHHRHPEREQRPCDPSQRRDAAGLLVHARPLGADGLLRHRRRRRRACPNTPRASSSSATTSRCRRSSCTASRRGSSASPSRSIGIGALVPAAIMSIAAANLYTRNIHREFISRNPTDKQEAQMAKWASLIVKFGALAFIVFAPTQYAIQLQLLGGIWIIQTLPCGIAWRLYALVQ